MCPLCWRHALSVESVLDPGLCDLLMSCFGAAAVITQERLEVDLVFLPLDALLMNSLKLLRLSVHRDL